MPHAATRFMLPAVGALATAAVLVTASAIDTGAAKRDLGREVLAANDGWASEGPGTTGGAAATDDHVYTVRNRRELLTALNVGTYAPGNTNITPKIIYVDGVIDMNVDDKNQPLSCADYQRDGYTLEAYLAAFDPAVWGYDEEVEGPLEEARAASAAAQSSRIRTRIGSNTTLVGLDRRAAIRGAWLDIRGSGRTNIIIRNIRFEDTYDCFPRWDPTDGSAGNWNAAYDSISIRDAHHIWIDHNDFADVETNDATAPYYFGRLYQRHDGLVDITNAANYVTVSWNRFLDHDKVMLIGSSDSGVTAANDRGKLKVTLHHNVFDGVGQRAPRVRFGQVHVYNNYYRIKKVPNYGYSWGVGIESSIYAEQNFFRTDGDVEPSDFIDRFNGTAVVTLATQVNAASANHSVDVRAAYNERFSPDLAEHDWTPTLFLSVDQAFKVPSLVASQAGPFNW